MKKQILYLIPMVCAVIAVSSFAQSTSPKTATNDKFFEVDQSIEELRQEITEIRRQIRDIELRTSPPEIRKEINRLIPVPDITHEIIFITVPSCRAKSFMKLLIKSLFRLTSVS